MAEVEGLRRARARALLRLLTPEQMPAWATEALVNGYDSPLLGEVAGMDGGDARDVRDAFTAALDELGAPTLTEEDALWEMSRAWAHAAVEGTMTPYEAARRIWLDASFDLDQPDALMRFVGPASEWEDNPEHRAAYDADILQAARDLLADS
ncbi:hypothetical protein [Kineococcus rubinsiae]|uniref:hypothetical protein n=1 Tax=Kineococcus rubinsiae TaxID=2609562 RepID=UPI00142F4156|nr:hypothetical protein [Kineococcus rubinsiae]NIZ90330.1 hypothetical protein [Kineococcus rubinsiae]